MIKQIRFSDFFSQKKSYLFIIITLVFVSCKENTILPNDLVPPIDNINTFSQDTFSIISNNVYQDSILTGGLRNNSQISATSTYYQALGTITNDPIFGKTNANIHVEVLPPVANFTFKSQAAGTSRTIDSIVLAIPFNKTYGDTITAPLQTYKVFRSLKKFDRADAQFEFTNDSIDNTPLSSLTVNYNTFRTDSPTVNSIKLVPQLRFKMSQSFIDTLENQIDLGSQGAAVDFNSFLNWWNGFYIQADSNSGNTLGYFDTYNTRLYIYYRYTKTDMQLDTVADVFSFDPSYCNRFNQISRNYTSTPIFNYLSSPNPNGDSILFVQREPGVAATIKFPYLHTLENCIVNQAELFLYAISPYNNFSDTMKFGMIPQMQIFQSDSAGEDKIIADYGLFGASVVDGTYKSVTIGGITYIRYKFAVTYAIQTLISEKNSNFNFKIMGLNNGYPASGRVMLAGNSTATASIRPKLKIIYTKIQK
ncbi:MAG: hypothetical protein IT215_06100 [Chitinophagaceae bacterium]|nr:MAG: hypothetical protein UZ11_BCD004000923 [Bacteroidetes bacterium OLB11]MCC6448238.1 hypothetical protein [Chitinophagaceae bacterium]HMN32829.1 hypothetical protein [Chitinophagaceae bacterium]